VTRIKHERFPVCDGKVFVEVYITTVDAKVVKTEYNMSIGDVLVPMSYEDMRAIKTGAQECIDLHHRMRARDSVDKVTRSLRDVPTQPKVVK
jgi:hypothetical protein